MKRSMIAARIRTDTGFVLVLVLVFLVVLSLTAFFAAGLTRTNIQVVNNLQNEKEALFVAEAGIQEALYRLSLAGGDTVTITGVNSGSAFNASLAPRVPGRPVGGGASVYGLDFTDTTSTSQIFFTTSGPAAGTNNRTPTLQPVTSRKLYSTATADTAPVDLASTANLTMGWEVCSGVGPGCVGANTIRQLPLSDPRPVVKIVSTGRSGSASKKITAWAVDICAITPTNSPPSLMTLGNDCDQGISMNGNTSVTATGVVQVNAGAASNPPSSCTDAVNTGGALSIVSASGINVAGSVSGNYSPPAQTGALPQSDPFASMLPPCFGSISTECWSLPTTPTVQNHSTNASLPAGCTGTAASPAHCSVGGITLNPGIYYGGISISGNTTLGPGVYIMAGGGTNGSFVATTGNTGVTSTGAGGLTIYSTQNDDVNHRTGDGAFGFFSLGSGNATASLIASTTGPYAGMLLFQDRSNTQSVDLQGGNSGNYTLDGVIYAPSAPATLQGHTNETISGSIIVAGPISLTGGSNINIGNPSTPSNGGNCQGVTYTAIAWQDF